MQPETFDTYASTYDSDFTFSPIGKLQRARVFHILNPFLKHALHLLELNCGTGYDAVFLASKGHKVVATDISAGMIETAKKRVGADQVEWIRLDMQKLDTLSVAPTDLIFSNFGGLNCLNPEAMQLMPKKMHQLCKPKAHIALVIMGSKCIWEDIYFKRIRHVGYRRRQKKGGSETVINGHVFTTWYYTPQQITNFFSNHFETVKVRPVGLFLPPSYLNYFFAKRPLFLKLLSVFENLIGRFSFLSNYADHYIIILKRKEL